MGRGVFFFGVGVEVGERVRRWKGGTSHPLPEPPLLLQGGRPLPRRALGERGGGGEGGRGAACPSPHGPGSLGMPARCGPLGHQEPLSRGQEEQAPARRAVVAAARRLPHKERQARPLSAPHVHRHTQRSHIHMDCMNKLTQSIHSGPPTQMAQLRPVQCLRDTDLLTRS